VRALGDVFKRASVPFGRACSSRFQRAVETARLAAGKDPEAITLIVTHKPNILDALGKDWVDVREGEASIFKPDGKGGAALVGRVQISEWTLAK